LHLLTDYLQRWFAHLKMLPIPMKSNVVDCDQYNTIKPNCQTTLTITVKKLEIWANAQRDGRPAEHRWRPLFNATKYG